MKAKVFLILGSKKTPKYKFFLFANVLNFFLKSISFLLKPISVYSIISKNNLLGKINFIFDNDIFKLNQSFFSKSIDVYHLRENTKFGIHCLELSGAERQRIAIAGTLYKNLRITFLDEFTNSLDVKTEENFGSSHKI